MPSTQFAGQTAGIYPRVSSKKPAKRDKNSLGDQEAACRGYADDLGMVVDEAAVRPETYTSTVMKRPELNVLLAEMKARHVPNLIIDRADRMTRAGQIAASIFLQQFTRAGITLHVVSMDLVEARSEEHTSELQSLTNLVCRLLLEKKKKIEKY